MVQEDEKAMLPGVQGQKRCTQQRSVFQVKGARHLCLDIVLQPRGTPGLREYAEILPDQLKLALRRDNLHRPSLADAKTGSQRLVSPNNFLQGLLQRCAVERSCQTQEQRKVVDCRVGYQLVQKPEPLLRGRQWGLRPGRMPGNLWDNSSVSRLPQNLLKSRLPRG